MTGERVERRLAAVLAADVAGYSRLMGLDEEGTLARLKAVRKALVDPTIATHRGRIVKTTGDGMLVEFASAVDAARCAIEVQQGMAGQHADRPPDTRIEFRIGVHVGDIIIDDNDIFGDGVNIAARLEGIAEPGGVCISDDAYRQIRDRVDAAFDDKGEIVLKNIARPVRVFALASAKHVTVSLTQTTPMLALPDKPSIAVLPFQNMSGDPEQEYFADGMVEDIITALSKIQWLFVIARNSTFTYKGKPVDIKQVGRELGVRYVLEGSVRKAGNRVRITGQLIDAATGAHLWADRFDGSAEDIFDLQDNITKSVVVSISPKLRQSEIDRSKRKPTKNLTAYDFYLQGIAKIYQYKRSAHLEAQSLFEKAIELDPEFAIAYAASALWYCSWRAIGWSTDRVQEAKKAGALAQTALELLRDDALVLAQAGWTFAFLKHELEEGAELTKRATDADPNYAQAWNWRGWINLYLGGQENAIEHFQRALRLNPVDPSVFFIQSGLAHANLFSGHLDEASLWAQRCVHENPQYLGGRRINIVCRALSGRIEEAKAEWDIARQIDPTQRISDIVFRNPFRNDEHVGKLAKGFRLAGMPE